MKVIIMRGPSGSGKSRWVDEIRKDTPSDVRPARIAVVSADDAHMVDGVYRYDPKKAADAHGACLHRFITCLAIVGRGIGDPYDLIIVDNTNTTAWEIAPYYQAALAFGADVSIVRVHASFEDCVRRTQHSVPASTIYRMHQNILTERLPGHWKEEIVLS